jgi:hypothetical protein
MSTYTRMTRTAMVLCSHSEESTYRDAMGGAEPLRVFVVDGPIDAPEWHPAGGMRSSKNGPIARETMRNGWYAD